MYFFILGIIVAMIIVGGYLFKKVYDQIVFRRLENNPEFARKEKLLTSSPARDYAVAALITLLVLYFPALIIACFVIQYLAFQAWGVPFWAR